MRKTLILLILTITFGITLKNVENVIQVPWTNKIVAIKEKISAKLNKNIDETHVTNIINFYKNLETKNIIKIDKDLNIIPIVNYSFSNEKSQGINNIEWYWWGINFYLDQNVLNKINDVSSGVGIFSGISTILSSVQIFAVAATILAPITFALSTQAWIMSKVSVGCGAGASMSYFIPGILLKYWAQLC